MAILLALLAAKLALYVALFALVNRRRRLGPGRDAAWAGVYRFLLGPLASGLALAVRAVLLNTAAGDRSLADPLATALIWLGRAGAWALATSLAFPKVRLFGRDMGVTVAAGLLLNLGLDGAIRAADRSGRGAFAPTFGEWELGLC